MKPSFHAIQVNGPFEDPCVYLKILRESRALLFDAGDVGRLESGNILKVTDIFVTHAHMDHFVGFDTVLRAVLSRDAPLRVYGPETITGCIEGKLKGYSWNLIAGYPAKIEVFGIKEGIISHSSFYAENGFQRVDRPVIPSNGLLREEPLFKVKGLVLSHQIPVIAYSVEEDFHININKAELAERGLPVGPWLSEFKRAVREGASDKMTFKVAGRILTLGELRGIATITRGQKISYVMDVAPTDENIAKIIPFVAGSDTLFCEAYFLERDRDRAMARHHLTAALAGRIAREANAGNLEIMHFSPKYRHCADELYQEAENEFKVI